MDPYRPDAIPVPAVRRFSLYLRQLEGFHRQGRRTVSSKQLGESLSLADAQVRKDLGYIGQFGFPGVGYRVEDLIAQVRRILGTDHTWNVILIGHGNLGRALVSYRGFEAKGFRLVAIFDADPAQAGGAAGGVPIYGWDRLEAVVRDNAVRVAMIAVPASGAQEVADRLVAVGIQGILNFAPTGLTVPSGVAVNSVDLAVQLEQLAFQSSLTRAAPPLAGT